MGKKRKRNPIPEINFDQLAAGALQSVLQVGARAFSRALDSILEDVGGAAQEVGRRTQVARSKLNGSSPPRGETRTNRPDVDDDSEED